MLSRSPLFPRRPGQVDLPANLAALAIGVVGGVAAKLLGLPLPMLLGSLLAVGAAALADLKPLKRRIAFPARVRTAFIPVIGVSIGAAFTPDILDEIGGWWPSLLALALFIPLAHGASYTVTRLLGDMDRVTAYYGSAPGGLIEAVMLGEAAGGDTAMLTMLQFLRLILTIILVPLGFTLFTGHAVGSAGGAVIGGGTPLGMTDWAVLVAAGVSGALGGRRLGLPAGVMTGPILVSGAAHLAGWVSGGPPGWAIDVTQLVVGTSLGVRFAGKPPRLFVAALRVAVVSIAVLLAMAAAAAALLHGVVGERWEAVFLAFAPGGLAEMSLVALSLEISVIYVTVHHVLRIILAVTSARLFAHLALRGA